MVPERRYCPTDVPLPPENQSSLPTLPNGTASGNASRPHTWGTANWQLNGALPAVANAAKPPLGRDPKSRARSREYIKQFVKLFRYVTRNPTLTSCSGAYKKYRI